jgi:hypothetical protein
LETGAIIGIGVSVATALLTTLVFGAFFLHFHDKLKRQGGRTEIITSLTSQTLAEAYTSLLAQALAGARKVAGDPFSLQSVNFCFLLAMAYALLAALAGWGGGGGQLGAAQFFGRPVWVPASIGDGWVALGTAIALAAMVGVAFFLGRLGSRLDAEMIRRGRPWLGGIAFAVAVAAIVAVVAAVAGAVAGAGAVAVAIAGVGAGAVAGVGVGAGVGAGAGVVVVVVAVILGVNDATLAMLIFWTVLPLINTASDYLSLGFSHWLGRRIVDDSGHSICHATFYSLCDLGLALVFMLVAAATIPLALALLQSATGVDLGIHKFISDAAADPAGAGLWFGVMILTTLVWTGLHLLVTIGALFCRLNDNFPLDRRAVETLRERRDSLWVKLYLSGKWLLVVVVWLALLAVFFWLLNIAIHGLTALFGSNTGLIGVLEATALWGADLILAP